MHTQRNRSIYLAITVLVLAGLACGSFSLPFADSLADVEQRVLATLQAQAPATGVQVSSDMLSQQESLISLYQTVSPGVVSISTMTSLGGSQGSGFVYDTAGHIVTNFHVVEGAEYIEITFTSGRKAIAEVIGEDRNSDLAVLNVDVPARELHPVTLGDSDALQVGQYVVAIGNPFGLSGSMSVGIVSSKGRTLSSLNTAPNSTQPFSAGDIIQTDAAINPGNSGGPLLNLYGEVVGVNRAIRSFNFNDSGDTLNSGIGFAVSVNIVKRVVPSLIETGQYDYPYLGVRSTGNLSLAEARELGLENVDGALVVSVVEGGPADEAGLLAGDMIVAIDGKRISNFDELISHLFTNNSPGDTIRFEVLRNNERLDIDLVLGARP